MVYSWPFALPHYVNDIDKSTMGNISSFADDLSLYISETFKSKIYITGSVLTGYL